MKKLFALTMILALPVFHACYYDNEEELYPGSVCATDNVSFTTDVLPVIQSKCAISGCHVAGTGRTVLANYTNVKSIADDGSLNQRVAVSRNMPPSGPLSACQIQQLQAWIEQGALNN